MATALQTNQTSNGASSGVQIVKPVTILFEDSVFDGATVEIQLATEDTDEKYRTPDDGAVSLNGRAIKIYVDDVCWIRAKVNNANSKTNITSMIV